MSNFQIWAFTNSEFGVPAKDVVKEVLTELKVPHEDPCCTYVPNENNMTNEELSAAVNLLNESTTTLEEELVAATENIYRATLTQSGTDAPVATVLTNTTGVTLTWSYSNIGTYLLTGPANTFPAMSRIIFYFGNTLNATYVLTS